MNTVLILLIILLIVAYSGYRMGKMLRRSMQAAREIADAIREGEMQAQNTPRSLSAMDHMLISKIRKDFPEYDLQLMRRRARQDARQYYESLRQKSVLFGEKDGVYSFLQEMQQRVGADTRQIKRPIVHRTALSAYENSGRNCFVTYQAACQYENNGMKIQAKLQLRYIAAEEADIEQNIRVYACPNCGAPVSAIGQKVCEYCDTALAPAAALSWMLFDMEEM